MGFSFAILIAVGMAYFASASTDGTSDGFPEFFGNLQTCVTNNDYPQIIQLLKKCRDGEINLKPKEWRQCYSTVVGPIIPKIRNHTAVGGDIDTFVYASLANLGLMLKGLLRGKIGGVLSAILRGTVGGLKGNVDGLLDGLKNGGLIKGLIQFLSQGALAANLQDRIVLGGP